MAAWLVFLSVSLVAGPAGKPGRCRGTRVVMLGTGSPAADPSRAGPSLAVVVDGRAYLVDSGAGVVKRAVAGLRKACPGLRVRDVDRVFLTHLHSDHTVGLPDMLLIPWALGRKRPLRIYGPPGTRAMVENLKKAYRQDIQARLASRARPRLLVLYHQLTLGATHRQLLGEIRRRYRGRVLYAKDLDVIGNGPISAAR